MMVPETGALGPWPPSLLTTRTLSTYTLMASSLVDVKVVGPGVAMLIMPVQRTPKLVVGHAGAEGLAAWRRRWCRS